MLADNEDIGKNRFGEQAFLETVSRLIRIECTNNRIKQLIFRGKYCSDPSFLTRIIDFIDSTKFVNMPGLETWNINSRHMVSHGATFFGLGAKLKQIPKLIKQPISKLDYRREAYKDDQENCIVLGIGKFKINLIVWFMVPYC